MWKCKHCENSFDFTTTSEKANHSRWCEKNPKVQEYKEKNAERAKQTMNQRFGEVKKYNVECASCTKTMVVEERETSFPSKDQYYCSRSCANSVGGTAKALKYHPDEDAHYRTVFNRHNEEMKCLVCGFDKIVEVHHVDEDHSNNSPENLVPLCPNHHKMIHSRYTDEVQPLVDEYVKQNKVHKQNCCKKI